KAQGPRQLAHLAEAAAHEQTAEAPQPQPDRHHHAAHVGALPKREAVTAKQPNGTQRGRDEAAIKREAAAPHLRPCPTVRLFRPATPGASVPNSVELAQAFTF